MLFLPIKMSYWGELSMDVDPWQLLLEYNKAGGWVLSKCLAHLS